MGIDFQGIREIGIRHSAPKDQGATASGSSLKWEDLSFKISPPDFNGGVWKKIVPVKEEGNTLTIQIRSFIPGQILDEQEILFIGYELFHLSDELKKPENLRDGKPPVLRLDFSNITYMSTVILGKFIALNRKQEIPGSNPPAYAFELENMDPEIYDVFLITKLNKLFTIINPPAPTPEPYPYYGNGSGRGNLY